MGKFGRMLGLAGALAAAGVGGALTHQKLTTGDSRPLTDPERRKFRDAQATLQAAEGELKKRQSEVVRLTALLSTEDEKRKAAVEQGRAHWKLKYEETRTAFEAEKLKFQEFKDTHNYLEGGPQKKAPRDYEAELAKRAERVKTLEDELRAAQAGQTKWREEAANLEQAHKRALVERDRALADVAMARQKVAVSEGTPKALPKVLPEPEKKVLRKEEPLPEPVLKALPKAAVPIPKEKREEKEVLPAPKKSEPDTKADKRKDNPFIGDWDRIFKKN